MWPSQTSACNAIEGIVFAAETILRVRSADEAAVESVGPAVIAALDPSREMSFAPAQMRVPRCRQTLKNARNESLPSRVMMMLSPRNFAQKIVARRRNLIGAPGADPRLGSRSVRVRRGRDQDPCSSGPVESSQRIGR